MSREIILISWEFPDHNTQGGTALSRRVGILYQHLTRGGKNVFVITKNHFDSSVRVYDKVTLLPGPDIKPFGSQIGIIRRVVSFLTSCLIGDRSGWWGIRTFFFIVKHKLVSKDDIIISFFTPRGPVLTGYLLKRVYGCKWLVDFQDTFDEGLGKKLFAIGKWWFKNVIKRADTVVHVSSEWSSRDGVMLNKSFITLRHCLPEVQNVVMGSHNIDDEIKVLYYGSIDINKQLHPFFFKAIQDVERCKFFYAGHNSAHEFFLSMLGETNYQFLGWLKTRDLLEQMQQMTFIIIFSYTLTTRLVVPSKLYEIISWKLPCVIIGEDSGGIRSLEREFGFSFVKAKTELELKEILSNPSKYRNQDYSVFNSLSEKDFVSRYIALIENQ